MTAPEQERWLKGSYYVLELPASLQLILWDYGCLRSCDEMHYVKAKMSMLELPIDKMEVERLAELIIASQNLVRQYAEEQLCHIMKASDAKIRSFSSVSQRDIQRVFKLYSWLLKSYQILRPSEDIGRQHRRAVSVALGMVYYLRLNKKFRDRYKTELEKRCNFQEITFSSAFEAELSLYSEKMHIPSGIAKTTALKENILAIILCAVTCTPLIIVGAPGSSKTLSFNLVSDNLKGKESKMELYRKVELFPSLDPYRYQCSKQSNSNEIKTVFEQAIRRQLSHNRNGLPVNCIVFMDEAGLPEESHESLKILHYYLDNPEVSFVAISNQALDAAKTNRAISLYRHESPNDDLQTLAKGCFGLGGTKVPKRIIELCHAYTRLCKDKEMQHWFGLRDFIHFISYLRRRSTDGMCKPEIEMQALERNFNGSEKFDEVCKIFLPKVSALQSNTHFVSYGLGVMNIKY